MLKTSVKLSYDTIKKLGQTGDIVLFYSKAKWFDYLIECFTCSNISHVGMILENPTNIDPTLNEGLYLIESCLTTVPDRIYNKRINGVQINKLDDVLKDYMNKKNRGKIYYRFLDCTRDLEFRNNIKNICKAVYAKPYDTHIMDWLRAEVYISTGEEMGNIEKRHKTDTFWCSALVAYIYVQLGFLKKDIPWTMISPAAFSINDINYDKLHFIGPCKLMDDTFVSFN
jgi:hypothetical protein